MLESDPMASPNIIDGTRDAIPQEAGASQLRQHDAFLTYDADPRPTFVVDLSLPDLVQIIYSNSALDEDVGLVACVEDARQQHGDFCSWVLATSRQNQYYQYAGILWHGFLVRGQWKVISNVSSTWTIDSISQRPLHHDPSGTQPTQPSPPDEGRHTSRTTTNPPEDEFRPYKFGERQNRSSRSGPERDAKHNKRDHAAPSETASRCSPAQHAESCLVSLTEQAPGLSFDTVAHCTSGRGGVRLHEPDSESPAAAWKPPLPSAPVKDTADSDTRTALTDFQRLADMVDVGFFDIHPSGYLVSANNSWYTMNGHPRDPALHVPLSFMDCVYPDDMELATEKWETLVAGNAVTFEMRWKAPSQPGDDPKAGPRALWVLSACVPVMGADGAVRSISGFTINIHSQKQRAEEALEAKRQQENFIDITSHEMRNPLSAIIQCADCIHATLADVSSFVLRHAQLQSQQKADLEGIIETGVDAAQTILSCAAHQKRIVDDILTLSKLDSDLLLITPTKTNVGTMVQGVMKILKADSKKADVDLALEWDQSLTDCCVEWLALDPSRVLQILINLIANAVKFTAKEDVRRVVVRLSVSRGRASKNKSAINYIPAETIVDDSDGRIEPGKEGEVLYLTFDVQDTGRGLNQEEQTRLFRRFSQASPKTHVQYGGSGLGLFISRKLTEMQGGEIGFASEAGTGSTFSFYIKARRTTPPLGDEISHLRQSPLAMTPAADVTATTSRQVSQTAMTARPTQEGPQMNITVLLVEDNLVNQKVLSQQLKRLGCKVVVAGHGVEALEFIETTQIWSGDGHAVPPYDVAAPQPHQTPLPRSPLDVVLMDIEMPVMGGLECTRRIRQLQAEGKIRRHIPVISISANARAEQVAEAKLAGVDDTITKPFRIPELMPKIQMLVPI